MRSSSITHCLISFLNIVLADLMQLDFSINATPAPILTLGNHPLHQTARRHHQRNALLDAARQRHREVCFIQISHGASPQVHWCFSQLQNTYRLSILLKLTASPQLIQFERVQKKAAKLQLEVTAVIGHHGDKD